MSALERLGIYSGAVGTPDSVSDDQEQTGESFGFKWARRESYESQPFRDRIHRWLIDRYCGGDPEAITRLLGDGGRLIVDAGCGSGVSSMLLFGDLLNSNDYLGVDISASVHVAERRFMEAGLAGDFFQCDLMDLPIPDRSLDVVFSEGVLHHTDNTGAAVKYLSTKLKSGGRFLFYVYARKALLREAADDLIRERLREMTDEEAWEALLPLTRLGKALGELDVEIEVEEDVDILGIKAGTLDIQRFLYWNLFKAFYSPELTIEEMNHINFDWYRPLNCHRHTPEEVRSFCEDADLEIERFSVEEAGITVVARKR